MKVTTVSISKLKTGGWLAKVIVKGEVVRSYECRTFKEAQSVEQEMKMEIPTHTGRDINKALEIIEAQAREIRDLQLTICRLKDEYRISSDLRELEARNG